MGVYVVEYLFGVGRPGDCCSIRALECDKNSASTIGGCIIKSGPSVATYPRKHNPGSCRDFILQGRMVTCKGLGPGGKAATWDK